THFIYTYGDDALRERYLVPALRGELVATFAMTEPNAGSDVANLATRAERRGDRWVLRGTKTWVTNAPVADVLTVAAKTSGERGRTRAGASPSASRSASTRRSASSWPTCWPESTPPR